MAGSFYENTQLYDALDSETSLLAATTAQAVLAAAAATSAGALLTDFESRYLGAKASDPSLDNAGLPLQAGAGYFSTVTHLLRVYTGSVWIDLVAAGVASFNGRSGAVSPQTGDYTAAQVGAAALASPAFTGVPTAPTAAPATNTTQLATTAYADAIAALKANLASPTFTGVPAAPTAAVDTNTTQVATTAMVLAQAASASPVMDGAAAVGVSTKFARQDHVHASDTSRAPLASPTFTGVPAAPTAAVDTNTTQLATTAMVLAQAGSATPLIDATVAVVGVSTRFARQDHVHPTDTTRAQKSQTDFISGIIKTGANADFRVVEKIPFGATITSISGKTASGTITLTFKINTTAITTGVVSATSSQSSVTPSAANVMVATDALVITGSSNSSAVDISFTVVFTKTLS